MVDRSGCPRIAEFGVVGVLRRRASLRTHGSTRIRRCAHWAEPGAWYPEKEFDVFSFGMVMVEVGCGY